MFKLRFATGVAFAAALLTTISPAQTQDGRHILSPAQVKGKRILLVAGEAEKDHPNDDLLVRSRATLSRWRRMTTTPSRVVLI
jgi:hypothetical protein